MHANMNVYDVATLNVFCTFTTTHIKTTFFISFFMSDYLRTYKDYTLYKSTKI